MKLRDKCGISARTRNGAQTSSCVPEFRAFPIPGGNYRMSIWGRKKVKVEILKDGELWHEYSHL